MDRYYDYDNQNRRKSSYDSYDAYRGYRSNNNTRNRIEWETDEDYADHPVFWKLKWVLTDDESECDRVLSFLEGEMGDELCVGLDLEYNPYFRKGYSHKTALIQISVDTGYCLLVRVIHMHRLPAKLEGLLINPDVTKVGVGIKADATKIFKDFGIRVLGCRDLNELAKVPGQKIGLAMLTNIFLKTDLPKEQTLSIWSQELSLDQQAYAARDAFAAACIARKIYDGESLFCEEESRGTDSRGSTNTSQYAERRFDRNRGRFDNRGSTSTPDYEERRFDRNRGRSDNRGSTSTPHYEERRFDRNRGRSDNRGSTSADYVERRFDRNRGFDRDGGRTDYRGSNRPSYYAERFYDQTRGRSDSWGSTSSSEYEDFRGPRHEGRHPPCPRHRRSLWANRY